MKKFLFFMAVLSCYFGYGQSIGYLRYDTVYIMKNGGTAEMRLMNKTKDSLGFLYNVGGGLTQFKRIRQLNDTTFIAGIDTILIKSHGGSGGGSSTDTTAIHRQIISLANNKVDSIKPLNDSTFQYWINGRIHNISMKGAPFNFLYDPLTLDTLAGGILTVKPGAVGSSSFSWWAPNIDTLLNYKPTNGTIGHVAELHGGNGTASAGVFVYNSTSTATADNMAVYAPTAGGTGRWVIAPIGGMVTTKQLGIFTASDNTAQLIAAKHWGAVNGVKIIHNRNTTYNILPVFGGAIPFENNMWYEGEDSATSIINCVNYSGHIKWAMGFFPAVSSDTVNTVTVKNIRFKGDQYFTGYALASGSADSSSRFISVNNGKNITIQGCSFEGGGTKAAIYLYSVTNGFIRYNRFNQIGGDNVGTDYSPGNKYIYVEYNDGIGWGMRDSYDNGGNGHGTANLRHGANFYLGGGTQNYFRYNRMWNYMHTRWAAIEVRFYGYNEVIGNYMNGQGMNCLGFSYGNNPDSVYQYTIGNKIQFNTEDSTFADTYTAADSTIEGGVKKLKYVYPNLQERAGSVNTDEANNIYVDASGTFARHVDNHSSHDNTYNNQRASGNTIFNAGTCCQLSGGGYDSISVTSTNDHFYTNNGTILNLAPQGGWVSRFTIDGAEIRPSGTGTLLMSISQTTAGTSGVVPTGVSFINSKIYGAYAPVVYSYDSTHNFTLGFTNNQMPDIDSSAFYVIANTGFPITVDREGTKYKTGVYSKHVTGMGLSGSVLTLTGPQGPVQSVTLPSGGLSFIPATPSDSSIYPGNSIFRGYKSGVGDNQIQTLPQYTNSYTSSTGINPSISGSGVRSAYWQMSQIAPLNKISTATVLGGVAFNINRVTTDTAHWFEMARAGMRAIAALQFSKNPQYYIMGNSSVANQNVTTSLSGSGALATSLDTLKDFGSRAWFTEYHDPANGAANWWQKSSITANETYINTNVSGPGIVIGTWADSVGWSRISWAVTDPTGIRSGIYDPNNRTIGAVKDYQAGTTQFIRPGIINDAIIVSGLTDTLHTVSLTFLDGGKRGGVDYIAGLKSPYEASSSPLYIFDNPHMNSTGYATTGGVTTQAILDSGSATILRNLQAVLRPYTSSIIRVNQNAVGFYDPTDAAQVQADGIHPTGLGNQNWSNALQAAMPAFKISASSVASTGGSQTLDQVLTAGATTTQAANIGKVTFPKSGSGTPGLFTGSSATTNADMFLRPESGTNTASGLWIMPRGTGASLNRSQLILFNTDYFTDQTNYAYWIARADGTDYNIASQAGGTGTVGNFTWSVGSHTNMMEFRNTGYIAHNGTPAGSTSDPYVMTKGADSLEHEVALSSLVGTSQSLNDVATVGNTTQKAIVITGDSADSKLQVGSMGLQSQALNTAFLWNNLLYTGSDYKYKATGYGSGFTFYNGNVLVNTAPSGSSGASALASIKSPAVFMNTTGDVAIGGNIGPASPYTGSALIAYGNGTVNVAGLASVTHSIDTTNYKLIVSNSSGDLFKMPWQAVTGGSAAWGSITGTLSSQTDLNTALGLKAPLASPALTGTPTAPTATVGTNTTQIATTAFVLANAGGGITNVQDIALIGASATATPTAYTTANDGTSHNYQVMSNVKITAISSGTLTTSVTYTDETNASVTLTFYQMGNTSGSLGGTGTSNNPPMYIKAKANTTIQTTYTFAGTSITYNYNATILKLN